MPSLDHLARHNRAAAKVLRVSRSLNSQDAGFYVHPHLQPDNDQSRGRLLRVSGSIRAGTVLLVDTPYATVPTVESPDGGNLICSNLECSRCVVKGVECVHCPEACFRNVVWCNETCRANDYMRHEFECLWLKKYGEAIRRNEGQYNFVTLWHVVRMLAGRNLEIGRSASSKYLWQKKFQRGWDSVMMCCAYLESWPDSQIKHWRRLAETYLHETPVCILNIDEMVLLICKEETNTFGLYPGITGPLYMIDRPLPRGESYGLSIFPRAAMFNHSCVPNVSHTPDNRGRMVYTAARDIAQGEECMISYFDLTERGDLEMRQKWTLDQFRFSCTCERCLEDEIRENLVASDWLPFRDI